MNLGENQVEEDPGDDTVILRVRLVWTEKPMSEHSGSPIGFVHRNPDGAWMLLMNVPRGSKRQHQFVQVDPEGIRRDRWRLVKLGPGVWDVDPSIVVPGQLHAFVTLVDVPEPAPWVR